MLVLSVSTTVIHNILLRITRLIFSFLIGIYDLVNNLGSTAARLLFSPMEESCHFVFNQCLLRNARPNEQDPVSYVSTLYYLQISIRDWLSYKFALNQTFVICIFYEYNADSSARRVPTATYSSAHLQSCGLDWSYFCSGEFLSSTILVHRIHFGRESNRRHFVTPLFGLCLIARLEWFYGSVSQRSDVHGEFISQTTDSVQSSWLKMIELQVSVHVHLKALIVRTEINCLFLLIIRLRSANFSDQRPALGFGFRALGKIGRPKLLTTKPRNESHPLPSASSSIR